MSEAIQKTEPDFSQAVERALVVGDLSKLTTEQRIVYYNSLCQSIGLNPLSRPFEYITLNGKLVLYARKDCTDQLRKLHNVSITITARENSNGCWVVSAMAKTPAGRTDESIGAVNIGNIKGDQLANALMKAETKAKRRVTLSICGLGVLDETEIDTIPAAVTASAATHQDLHHSDKTQGYGGEPDQRSLPAAPEPQTENPTNVQEQLANLAKLKTIIEERKVTAETQAKWCEKFGGVASIDQLSDEIIVRIINKYESLKQNKAA